MEIIANYINGELIKPVNGNYLDNFEPASGLVYGQIPNSDSADLELAVQAAKAAQDGWANTPVAERVAYLRAIADLIEERLEELALAEAVDNGKPLSLARTVDIPRAASNFRYFADAVTQMSNEAFQTDNQALNFTLRKPHGVVACISPWNLPLYLFTWKIAPALATGNCVIAKPSEVTPMTAFLLSELCIQVGLPAGVLNIVHGEGASIGTPLVSHDDIAAVSFTGGTATGAKIAEIAAPKFKKLSLELGGKNPALIFDDCDFDATVNEVAKLAFANQGQICLCGSRIYIQDSIYEKFRDALVEKVSRFKAGDPLHKDTRFGAVVSKAHQHKILSAIETAKEEGGKLLCGGEAVQLTGRCAEGYFIAPTIFEDLPLSCSTNQQEIFGPVITLAPFASDEESTDIG